MPSPAVRDILPHRVSCGVLAYETSTMPDTEIKDIRPDEAIEMLRKDPRTVLIDVRTTMEYQYVGHPLGALHVPWMEAPEWRILPDFCQRVQQAVQTQCGGSSQDVTVLTLCRSGKRSRAAAEALRDQGYRAIFNIAEGFEGDINAAKHRSELNGWKQRGLPWEQS